MSINFIPGLSTAPVAENKGRIVGQMRSLLPRYVWSILVQLEMAGNVRDLLCPT